MLLAIDFHWLIRYSLCGLRHHIRFFFSFTFINCIFHFNWCRWIWFNKTRWFGVAYHKWCIYMIFFCRLHFDYFALIRWCYLYQNITYISVVISLSDSFCSQFTSNLFRTFIMMSAMRHHHISSLERSYFCNQVQEACFDNICSWASISIIIQYVLLHLYLLTHISFDSDVSHRHLASITELWILHFHIITERFDCFSVLFFSCRL